jgi:hypothetical protein
VRRADVLAFRLRATHLHERLPAGGRSVRAAAWCGLQDSSPRSAVLSLHARVEGVAPDAWSHPALVQVWGPRGAVWAVPAAAVGVFTLGLLPRDARRRAEVEATAAAVRHVVGAGPRSKSEVLAAVPGLRDRPLTWAGATGTVRIRWDTRDTVVFACDPQALDEEEARHELARRFLRRLGPATVEGFAWWAGVPGPEARTTWDALDAGGELAPVGGGRWLHAADVHTAASPGPPPPTTRFLPPGDPYLGGPDRHLVLPDEAQRNALWPLANVPPGALLARGRVVGTWRRRRDRVAASPWAPLSRGDRAALEAEAAGLPLEGSPHVVWS